MTPSSIPLKPASKKLPANSRFAIDTIDAANTANTVRINIRPSRIQNFVQYGVASLAMLAPVNAQLPWLVTGIIVFWAMLAIAHLKMRSKPCLALVDEGEHWLVEFAHRTDRVQYERTDYCSAHLLVMRFRTRSGKIRRVSIWRDAVTQPAFSWLAARITLTSPDTKMKIMATS